MKSFVILAAIFLLGLTTAQARAQEPSLQFNVDTVTAAKQQRAPALVIHETAATLIKAMPDASKPQAAQKGASLKPAEKTPADKTAAAIVKPAIAAPPSPIVFSGNQPDVQVASQLVGTTGNPKYDELVMQAAARNGIDPNLIFAVMRQESGFQLRAVSYKGASGLMQLMPATARRFGVTNIFDPAQNIEAGAKYLRFLLDTFNGDVKLTLAGYNAGENAVIKSGYEVPRYRETQNYVRSITARYGATKHRAGASKQTASGPVAPSTMTFSGASSSRLSNNY
jgi:soluble lytic murein transglycosylase-like protein